MCVQKCRAESCQYAQLIHVLVNHDYWLEWVKQWSSGCIRAQTQSLASLIAEFVVTKRWGLVGGSGS